MEDFEALREFVARTERDLEEFQALLRSYQGKKYGEVDLRRAMFDSGQLLTDGTVVLMQLTLIRYQISRMFEKAGAFELTSTKRHQAAEVTDLITSLRTALSALSERARNYRELAAQGRQKVGSESTE